jgi:hypothetical protein
MQLAFRHMGGLSKDPEKRARQEAALRMSNPSAFTRSEAARQEPAEPERPVPRGSAPAATGRRAPSSSEISREPERRSEQLAKLEELEEPAEDPGETLGEDSGGGFWRGLLQA